jgi:aminomethyltransferase
MSEENLKILPLNDEHVKAGGKMVPFAGWLMPVQYIGVLKEHEIVRTNCGLFDISHMGEFMAEGKDVIPFLQYMVTNDLRLMENGKSQYANMCYENGTVVDDLIYYRYSDTKYRIIVNASNIDKDFKWLSEHIGKKDVKLVNLSASRCRLAFQGPKAISIMQTLVDADLSKVKRFYFKECNLKGVPIFLTRTGYTGEDGCELSCEKKDIKKVWNAIVGAGVQPIGLGARDSLRLEPCLSLYGHEINDHITPIEAGLNWAVKDKEGIDFIGKAVLMKQKKEGTDRVSVGLNLKESNGVIREHYPLFDGDKEIGHVTSGGWATTLKKSVGMGLVKKEYSKLGTEFLVDIRGKKIPVIVVPKPFYKSPSFK